MSLSRAALKSIHVARFDLISIISLHARDDNCSKTANTSVLEKGKESIEQVKWDCRSLSHARPDIDGLQLSFAKISEVVVGNVVDRRLVHMWLLTFPYLICTHTERCQNWCWNMYWSRTSSSQESLSHSPNFQFTRLVVVVRTLRAS